jgi:hypothetical protein
MTESIAGWFDVRCVFELDPEIGADIDPRVFEERVSVGRQAVWRRRSNRRRLRPRTTPPP